MWCTSCSIMNFRAIFSSTIPKLPTRFYEDPGFNPALVELSAVVKSPLEQGCASGSLTLVEGAVLDVHGETPPHANRQACQFRCRGTRRCFGWSNGSHFRLRRRRLCQRADPGPARSWREESDSGRQFGHASLFAHARTD